MKAKLRKITQSKFARDVAIVATGTAGAQALNFVFAPILTRVYGPEVFGVLGVFIALVGVLAPVAALSYPIAIVLPKQDRDALGLAWLSLYIAIVVCSLIAIISGLESERLLRLVGAESIADYSMLIPAAMFFAVFSQIAQQWLIRKKSFKISAKVAVIQSLVVNSAKTGFGFLNPVAYVLIGITIIGYALHALLLWVGIKVSAPEGGENGRSDGEIDGPFSLAQYKTLARKYYDFPLYRAPQILINAASSSLPVLMLASFMGPASAGFYTIARSVLAMPMQLIGGSVVAVFYPRFNEAAQDGEDLVRLLLKATGALALSGFVPFAVVIAFGPWLFALVFGAEWATAGEYGRWLSLWLYFGFLNRPSVAAIATLSLQGFFLVYELVSIMLRAIMLYVGFIVVNSDIVAVALFSLIGVTLNIALIITTLFKARAMSEKKNNE